MKNIGLNRLMILLISPMWLILTIEVIKENAEFFWALIAFPIVAALQFTPYRYYLKINMLAKLDGQIVWKSKMGKTIYSILAGKERTKKDYQEWLELQN